MRILGMGDVLTLIEKAETALEEKKTREMQERLLRAEFNLDDFLDQMQQMRRLGPLDQVVNMLPGANKLKGLGDVKIDEKHLARLEAIIRSMTPEERHHPQMIDGSRRRRIALGSGTKVQDVNRLLKQFDQMKQMLKQFGLWEKKAKRGGLLSRLGL
jgi:signal recognition particle subunit SRP54